MTKATIVTLGSRIAIAGEGLGLFKGKTAVAAVTDLVTTVTIEDVLSGISASYGPPYDRSPPSLDSVGAIIRTLRKRQHNVDNIRVTVFSTVPIGQGLASSGALLCALAKCCSDHFRLGYTLEELVNIAWEAERIDLGVVCGKFDQYAILFRGALLQDFAQEPVRIQRFSLPSDTRVVIGTTGRSTPYGDVGASIGKRFASGDPSVLAYRESMEHSVEDFVLAAEKNDKKRMGELISAFQYAIRHLLGIANPGIDALINAALVSGAYAAKTCGIRFDGGSMFALCTDDSIVNVVEAIHRLEARAHVVSIAYP